MSSFRGQPMNRPRLLRTPTIPGPVRSKYQYQSPAPYPQFRPARSQYNAPTPRGQFFNYPSPRYNSPSPRYNSPIPRFAMNEGASTSQYYQEQRSPYFGQQQNAKRAPYAGSTTSGFGNNFGSNHRGNGDDSLNFSSSIYNSGLADNFMRLRNPKSTFPTMSAYSNTPCENVDLEVSEFDDLIEIEDWPSNDLEENQEKVPAKNDAVKNSTSVDSVQSKTNTTMRILTVTPTSLKKMNFKNSQNKFMFEIFGTLSSDVTNGTYCSKHFCLKSNNDVISCVFYEIDRPLGNIIRNQLYRCVGYYESDDVIKCLSVRPATVAEKNHLYQMMTQIQDIEP